LSASFLRSAWEGMERRSVRSHAERGNERDGVLFRARSLLACATHALHNRSGPAARQVVSAEQHPCFSSGHTPSWPLDSKTQNQSGKAVARKVRISSGGIIGGLGQRIKAGSHGWLVPQVVSGKRLALSVGEILLAATAGLPHFLARSEAKGTGSERQRCIPRAVGPRLFFGVFVILSLAKNEECRVVAWCGRDSSLRSD
jgi:hypothetical protein